MKKMFFLGILLLIISFLRALSSYGTSPAVINDTVDPSLSLLSPNGGEQWYIGDTNNITWNATDTNLIPNSVYIWYSLDGGSNYLPLAEGIENDGIEPWTMPETQSYNARVKIQVADSFGNITNKSSASFFSITYVPPAEPTGVNVNISNAVDAVITWQPVTTTIYHTPIVPDGYIVLYNETPYEYEQFYYFLSMTTGLTYTHQNVARFRQQMFYKVVAFKDYEGRLTEILTSAKANPEQKLSLAEIKARLSSSTGGEK